jgi:mannosyl-3-phosphoglycerate phosphatase family protein
MRDRVLFTDLDGTLLGHDDYRPGPARAAVARLQDCGVAVIPVTSKTSAELGPIVAELGLRDGWVAENGAEIRWPGRAAPTVHGTPYDQVRAGLAAAAAAADVTVRGFGDMSDAEVAELTGLTLAAARAARARAYSESFVVLRGSVTALQAELRRRGLRAVRGGRFLTVTGLHDKGTAVRAILARRLPATSWAVGDAPNDGPMLAAVARPYQVRRPDGTWAALDVAGVTRVDGVGPAGFVQVAERLLAEIRDAPA